MTKWRVREGYQVKHDGKMLEAGDTFTLTEDQVAGRGLGAYVEEVAAERKADEPVEAKAQHSSENKAQRAPEATKSLGNK